jgi:hypothetical protein
MAKTANSAANVAIRIPGEVAGVAHAKRAAKIPAIILRIMFAAPYAAGRVIVADSLQFKLPAGHTTAANFRAASHTIARARLLTF